MSSRKPTPATANASPAPRAGGPPADRDEGRLATVTKEPTKTVNPHSMAHRAQACMVDGKRGEQPPLPDNRYDPRIESIF